MTAEMKSQKENQIKTKIPEQKYNTYFNETFFVTQITDEKIICQVTTNFLKKVIENHYSEFLPAYG